MKDSYKMSNPLLTSISLFKSAAKQQILTEPSSYMKKTCIMRYRAADRDFAIVKEITDFYVGKRIDICSKNHRCTGLMQHIRGVYDNCAYELRKLDEDDNSNSWKRKYYSERMLIAKNDMTTIKNLEEKYLKTYIKQ